MSSETALTGLMGIFEVEGQRVARSTKWDVDSKLATKSEWGDSDSGGHTNRAGGRKDKTFSAEGKYDTQDSQFSLFVEGDNSEVTLFLSKTPLLYYHFPRALCEDFKISVNIDTEEVIGWTSAWGEDGISYRPGQAGIPVKAYPT